MVLLRPLNVGFFALKPNPKILEVLRIGVMIEDLWLRVEHCVGISLGFSTVLQFRAQGLAMLLGITQIRSTAGLNWFWRYRGAGFGG